jgi:hypothetical protein
MPRKYIIFGSAIFVMAGHVAILPYIYFFLDNPQRSEKHDIAMIVAPLTAAYFITITKYVIDNAARMDVGADKVNLLFVATSVIVVVPFMISIFVLLNAFNQTTIDFSEAKAGVALIEVFFGGAFALFIDSLFGKSAQTPALQIPAVDTGP